jgi:amino acid transporter
MCLWSFGDLLVIDVTVYGAGLFLEYVSLIKLRITEPDKHRPFRIPLSVRWLCILLILPIGIYTVALSGVLSSMSSAWKPALFAIAAVLSGAVIWPFIAWRKKQISRA